MVAGTREPNPSAAFRCGVPRHSDSDEALERARRPRHLLRRTDVRLQAARRDT
jgi:hypothetical protein